MQGLRKTGGWDPGLRLGVLRMGVLGTGMLAILPAFAAGARPAERTRLPSHTRSGFGFAVSAAPAQAVREVDDPAHGARWLLVRDEAHPAGPGRWIRMDASGLQRDGAETARTELQQSDAQVETQGQTQVKAQVQAPAPILIRGGDSIIVEQSTPVLSARLEAVALEPASAGKLIEARLKATHARVWVIALGPGEAALAPPGVVGP